MISLLGMPAFPREAVAKDELFKKNPLTNPLLEQIRIWEQAEADDIKYGGELTPGDAGNKGRVDQYPKLLVPILKMSDELKSVETLVHGNKDEDWPRALAILQQPQFEKINFKRIFNSFADNVYYSDPDRANAYLGGGAVPKSEQSLLYLLRNEILTNIDGLTVRPALLCLVFCIWFASSSWLTICVPSFFHAHLISKAELEFLIKNEDDTEDLFTLSSNANAAMASYLSNVSPLEMNKAKELLASQQWTHTIYYVTS